MTKNTKNANLVAQEQLVTGQKASLSTQANLMVAFASSRLANKLQVSGKASVQKVVAAPSQSPERVKLSKELVGLYRNTNPVAQLHKDSSTEKLGFQDAHLKMQPSLGSFGSAAYLKKLLLDSAEAIKAQDFGLANQAQRLLFTYVQNRPQLSADALVIANHQIKKLEALTKVQPVPGMEIEGHWPSPNNVLGNRPIFSPPPPSPS